MLDPLTLDQLRVLVSIAETGSFSAAGRKLHRVQSAISHAVQSLEDHHGIRLFDRDGKIPRLTDAGRALVTQAQHVLRQVDVFKRTALGIGAGLEPDLSLALDSFVPTEPVIRALSGLQTHYPDLALTLFTEGMGAAERRVLDGTATLGLCPLLPAMVQDLQAVALTQVRLIPVAAPSHPLALEKRPLSRDILAQHVQLILTNPQQIPGPNFSVVSSRVWRFVEIARRLEFLLAGFGWGTMPSHLVKAHLSTGRLVRLEIDDPAVLPGQIGLYAIHDRQTPLGLGARWLLAELQKQDWPGEA